MYKIIFVDGTEFNGGNPENSEWNKIPDKPIAELYYDYLGKQIHLQNYEAYNHLLKHAFNINTQQSVIVAVLLLVKEHDIVQRFIYDLIRNELIVDKVTYGQEYNNKPALGWKAGLDNLKTDYEIN